jgi:hypothetical protein
MRCCEQPVPSLLEMQASSAGMQNRRWFQKGREEKVMIFYPRNRIISYCLGRAKHARQQLDAAQLAQSHRRDSGAIASPPATASRTVTTVADESAPEPSPTTLDLPTVPTISRDSAGGLQSTGSRVSTYPAQRIRSESEPSVSSERLRSSSINKDSSAPSVVDTVRVLDGVELNKVDVDALLKM